ncbi:MAG: hypothetical protein PGN34_00675 [Methylobacterium frigidaeris]
MNIEIARGLRDTDTTFPNQSNRLNLELTSELATLHGAPPASPSHLNQVSVKPAAGHFMDLGTRLVPCAVCTSIWRSFSMICSTLVF